MDAKISEEEAFANIYRTAKIIAEERLCHETLLSASETISFVLEWMKYALIRFKKRLPRLCP